MKSLMLLWQTMAQDLAIGCRTSTARDIKTVTRRVEAEGESFLTISLPNFGKAFERSLDLGYVVPSSFSGFHFKRGLPVFLQGFLELVFDPESGVLLKHPDLAAIRAVRQLTLVFGKVERPCTDRRIRKAFDQYVSIEMDLNTNQKRDGSGVSGKSHLDTSRLSRLAVVLFGRVLAQIEREIYVGDYHRFVPKHGPGSTADRLAGNAKYDLAEWTDRLEGVFPAGVFLDANWRYHRYDSIDFRDPGNERPVRVVSVPKTLKTPRIIAMEPTCMQYAQQAVLQRFMSAWKKDDYLPEFLGFDDQLPNRELARRGSSDSSLATIDLSEASDRVSNQLVKDVFARFPHFLEVLQATRSSRADVNGRVIELSKFASMGSALCFPIEAMVFLTLIFYGIEESQGHRLSMKDINSFIGQVRVFGDDIIIPVDYVESVIDTLEAFSLKVNRDKSFWTGKFRESCGGDYYDGHDVSIVRLRKDIPSSRSHVSEVLGLVSFRNQLYMHGLWETCRALDKTIAKILGYFPIVESTSPVVGRHSFFDYKSERECPLLHRPLVKGYAQRARTPKSNLSGTAALLKCLTQGVMNPDISHLERAGRPKRVDIKLGWHTPY